MQGAEDASRYDRLLDAVMDRLKAGLPARVDISRFPSRAEDYDFAGHDAAVLVICTESTIGRASTPVTAALIETLTIVCAVLVRSLDGAHGAPALLEDVRLALQGQSLAGATAMQPLGFRLADQGEGAFQFDISFETRLPAVAGHFHPAMR